MVFKKRHGNETMMFKFGFIHWIIYIRVQDLRKDYRI
jgi:hypothetical protein